MSTKSTYKDLEQRAKDLESGSDRFQVEISYRRFLAKAVLIIGLPMVILFGIHDFLEGRYPIAFMEILILLVLTGLLIGVLWPIKESRRLTIYRICFTLFIILLGVLFVYAVGVEGKFSRTQWCYVYPILVFFLVGAKEGLIWVLAFYGVMAALLSSTHFHTVALGDLKLRFLFSLSLVSILSYLSEYLLRRNQQKLNSVQLEIRNLYREAYQRVKDEVRDRKGAEEALRESEEKYRSMMESMCDPTYICSPDYRVEYMNPAMVKRSGWDAIGERCYKVIHELDEKCPWCVHNKVQQGESLESEIVSPKDGRSYNISHSPIFHDDGSISKMTIFRDIGERYKLEEERLKREKLESLGILAAGLAHNFNNILTVILGNVYFAKQDMDRDSEAYEVLQEVEKQTTKATNLTQQLLTFAKGGAPVKKTASLAEVIRESGNFVLKGSKVRCDVIILEDIWLSEIDVGQISQVTQNLIINADQATPEGGVIKIEIENRVIEAKDVLPIPSGKYVHVSVSDEGSGIQKKHLPKIFDPYFSTKKKGSGLGLATAHSIIKRHGGHITVNSEFGVGTVFHFYLPASEGEMVATRGVKEGLIKGDGKVLVMDNEESFRHMACQVLGKLGYEVDVAKDGEEAIEKYMRAMKEDEPFDAVILDLTIPGGLGGKETIRRLKEIDPEVKAVVASGYSHDPVMANFRDYGFIGVLPKPFGIDKLGRMLQDIILGKDS